MTKTQRHFKKNMQLMFNQKQEEKKTIYGKGKRFVKRYEDLQSDTQINQKQTCLQHSFIKAIALEFKPSTLKTPAAE